MLEGERAVFSVSAEIHRLLIYSSTSHLMQLRLCYARSWRSTCGGRRIWRRHLVAANAQGMAGGLNKPEGPRKARLRHRVGKPPLLHTLHEAIVLGASLTAGKHHSSPATSHSPCLAPSSPQGGSLLWMCWRTCNAELAMLPSFSVPQCSRKLS